MIVVRRGAMLVMVVVRASRSFGAWLSPLAWGWFAGLVCGQRILC